MESIYLKLVENRVVETKRLLLRPVTLDDAEDMFEYSSDEENTRYTFYLIKIWKKQKYYCSFIYWSTARKLGN